MSTMSKILKMSKMMMKETENFTYFYRNNFFYNEAPYQTQPKVITLVTIVMLVTR